MELRIHSVNVARPGIIGTVDGAVVLSAIAKRPLDQESVFVGRTNITGDGQADLTVHGGPDKAVYAYPMEHWNWWEREKGLPCKPATFGENLTLEGADETQLHIGDRFRWGDVLLEVSQPRAPCFKFAIHTHRADAPQAMTLSARSGWYLRVIDEGMAPVQFATFARTLESGGPTVRDAFVAALHPRPSNDLLKRVRDAAGLAESWRRAVENRL